MYDFWEKQNYYLTNSDRVFKKRGPFEQRLNELRKGRLGRIGRHVTNPMLAKVLGCTTSYYQRMEAGKYPMNDERVRLLAEYYGVDFEELKRLRDMERILHLAGWPEKDVGQLFADVLTWLNPKSACSK